MPDYNSPAIGEIHQKACESCTWHHLEDGCPFTDKQLEKEFYLNYLDMTINCGHWNDKDDDGHN